MTTALIVDAALALLLLAALVGGSMLSRRLSAFAQSREELAALGASLSGAVERAHQATAELRSVSDSAEGALARRLHEGRRLADELAIMQDSAESLACRLEQAARPAPAPGATASLAQQVAALEAARRQAQRP